MTMLFRSAQFHPFRLTSVAAMLLAANTMLAAPQQAPPQQQNPPMQQQIGKKQVSGPPAAAAQAGPDRSGAYYHYGLAHLYEEMAINAGRSDYATQAVEEYKLALSADPTSPLLQDGLADLYFKIGRARDAVAAAQA